MTMDLYSAASQHFGTDNNTWRLALALAHRHGWKPAWTTMRGNPHWSGSYCSNAGQWVSEDDSRALGKALKRAMQGISKKDLTDEDGRREIVGKVCHPDRLLRFFEEQYGLPADHGEVFVPGKHLGKGDNYVLMIPPDEMSRIYREFPDYIHDLSVIDLLRFFSGPMRDKVSALAHFSIKSLGFSIC